MAHHLNTYGAGQRRSLREPDIDGERNPKQEFRDKKSWTELRSSQLYHGTLLYALIVLVAS